MKNFGLYTLSFVLISSVGISFYIDSKMTSEKNLQKEILKSGNESVEYKKQNSEINQENKVTSPQESLRASVPTLEEIEKEYSHLSGQEIDEELQAVQSVIDNQGLIERANQQALSPEEEVLLVELIRKQAVLASRQFKERLEEIKSKNL